MDMKPIEPGCLAVVISGNHFNVGKIVTVGKFIGNVPTYNTSGDLLGVDKEMIWIDDQGRQSRKFFAPGGKLMRIDGHSPDGMDLAIVEQLKSNPMREVTQRDIERFLKEIQ